MLSCPYLFGENHERRDGEHLHVAEEAQRTHECLRAQNSHSLRPRVGLSPLLGHCRASWNVERYHLPLSRALRALR